MTINLVDVAAVLVVALAVYFGWRSGFAVQALALVGLVGGLALMIAVAPHLAGAVSDFDPLLRTVAVIGIVAGIVLATQGIGSGIGMAVRRRIERGVLGGVDMGAGAALGFLRGLFMVWLLGGLLAVMPLPTLAAEARQSLILRALETRLPSPVVLAAELGRIVAAAGLPDILVGVPPATDLPEDGPTLEEAERLAAAARRSTVRVEAIACGNFLTGTGFAVRGNRLVTNAHVVAGAERVWISLDGALDRHAAVVTHFDGQLDIAVLAVDGLGLEALVLGSDAPSRDEAAAALGFTGGGRQRLIPAVVSRSLEATGRDIYGSAIVARQVVELRADVAPGDSGGPVLLADGTVGGVTFSEARDNQLIGYALAPGAVADSIAPALARVAAAPTGACLA